VQRRTRALQQSLKLQVPSQWAEVTAEPSDGSPHCKRIGGSVDTKAFLECRRDLLLCKLKCCCHLHTVFGVLASNMSCPTPRNPT
jgi:hypothetical protein